MTIAAELLDKQVLELIKDLQEAHEPSRNLDINIHIYLTGKPVYSVRLWDQGYFTTYETQGKELPKYTASIDAALTLLPADPKNEPSFTYDWELEKTNGGLTVSARVAQFLVFANLPACALLAAIIQEVRYQRSKK